MKSIWKCRPHCGRHFDVGFINQALLAKVSLLDKAPFCGTSKPQSRPGNPTDKMKKMSIMANPTMSGGSLVFLTTAHNRAMSSHVQNRLSTDTCETRRYERLGTWFCSMVLSEQPLQRRHPHTSRGTAQTTPCSDRGYGARSP